MSTFPQNPVRICGLMALQMAVFLPCGNLSAQLSISAPEQAPEQEPGAIRQVSLESSQGIVAAREEASAGPQIRVRVQYLLIDQPTRRQMYGSLKGAEIRHSVDLPKPDTPAPLASVSDPLSCSRRFDSPARVSTCLLNDSQTAAILKTASQSQNSIISNAPSVILLEGKEAQMNDIVQHPFVVDVEEVSEVLKPSVQAVEDGTRIRLLARTDGQAEPSTITLTCEIAASQLLDVQPDYIFGLQEDGPMAVQAPVRHVTRAVVSQGIDVGKTLMIDPHVSKSRRVETQSGVPVLQDLPYVGRSFKSINQDTIQQHMIVLLRAEIERRVK